MDRMARYVRLCLGMAKRSEKPIADDFEHPDHELELALRLEPVHPDPTASATREPSRRLRLAVLADAIATFRRTAAPVTHGDERTFVEAVRWFASNDATDPLGFASICHALGLDAAHLRAGLRSIRMRARAARRKPVLHEERSPPPAPPDRAAGARCWPITGKRPSRSHDRWATRALRGYTSTRRTPSKASQNASTSPAVL